MISGLLKWGKGLYYTLSTIARRVKKMIANNLIIVAMTGISLSFSMIVLGIGQTEPIDRVAIILTAFVVLGISMYTWSKANKKAKDEENKTNKERQELIQTLRDLRIDISNTHQNTESTINSVTNMADAITNMTNVITSLTNEIKQDREERKKDLD
jgi:flagellar biosynthesis protein FliP